MFITLLLVAVVMAMDTLSAWLRRRYIGGNVVPLFKAELPPGYRQQSRQG
jgi:phosphonate transport system permease protein